MINMLWEKTFDFLVSTCGKYVVDTWRQRSRIENHLDTLQVMLPKAHGLIMRSECWRIPKYECIDKLLPLLKEAAYEAETVVDEVEYQRAKQNVQKDGQGEFLSDYFNNWMSGFPQKVKNVQENLYTLCKKMEDECNRFEIPENHNQFSKTARPITTKYGGAVFCGRDKELDDVIRLLGVYKCGSKSDSRKRKRNHNMSSMAIGESSSSIEKTKNVSILSIVGLGGVGKTTLAQMVYNDRSVQSYFEILIWICISENFDVRRLTKEIIECVTKRACNHANLNILQETLEQVLKEKRFLLVLDDAWSENETAWQQLLGPMKGGLQGSAILVTTRIEKVGEIASKGMNLIGPIYLEGLEENIYWEFFKSCAFGLQLRTENYPALEEIGKQICKKLRGSPLATKTIGGLLKLNLDEGHWTNIRDSKIWQLKQEEHHILPVLQLSYQYLPSHLKKCFSFCSLYPKDFKFTKTTLAKFWIKHGLISSPENPLHLQDILAEVYFDELIGRCFFQKAAESLSDAYVIHDLMHDVCQFITKDECFCIEDDTFEEKVSPDIRHLSVFQRKLINLDKQNELIKYKKLLSLSIDFSMGPQATRIEYWFNNLTTIRSLSLVNCINLELPESIGNLKHLQYLDISFTMNIPKLPHALCSLYSLKYLNMEGSLCSCSFPKGSDKLVSLQVFYFPRAGMPLDGSVMDLAKAIVAKDQKLFLTDHGSITNVKIQNLKHISIRGSLTIQNLEFVLTKEAAEEAELNKKSLIDRLDFWWSKRHEHDDEEVLEGLCPHPNLKELELHHYRGRNLSPSWLKEEFLPNLTEISIWHCESDFIISHLPRCITKLRIMHCSQLTSLENLLAPVYLPVLKHLEVLNCEKLVSLPVETFGGFSLLNQLRICGCPELTSCPNAMVLPPSLKHLHLASCGDIEKSVASSLQSLTSLEKLILRKCPNLVSIPPVVTSSLESLTLLEVHDCAEIQSLGGLQFRSSLHKVDIVRCPKLKETRAQYLTMQSGALLQSDVTWHEDNWGNPESRFLAFTLHDEKGGGDIYVAFNAHDYFVEAAIPSPPHKKHWHRVVDTNLETPKDIVPDGRPFSGTRYNLAPYSSILLEAKP